MKKILSILSLGILMLFAGQTVFADTNIHLEVETSTGTLYNQDINVTPCDTDGAGAMGTTAYCAVVQSGVSNNWSWFGTDAFLDSLGGVSNDNTSGTYWGWFSNLELGQTALNKYELVSGDHILINYGINPLKISVDKNNPSVGEDVKFTVSEFSYDSSFNPVWSPASGGEITIGTDTFPLDSSGEYIWKPTSANAVSVKARKLGFIDSQTIDINPKPATEKIFIRNGDTLIYSGEIPLPNQSTISITDKNGLAHDVSSTSVLAVLYSLTQVTDPSFTISDLEYYDSFGAFYVKCITPKDGTELCDNWQYAVNGQTQATSVDKTVLSGGESIGLYFGNPHQLLLDKTSINAGDSIKVTAQKYDYTNNTWGVLSGISVDVSVPNPNDIWNPTIVSNTPVDLDGKATVTINNEGVYTFGIKEDFSFPSYTVTVLPVSGGGGGGSGSSKNSISIPEALAYLSSKQKPNGSFGEALYTDWAAIAIASAGNQASNNMKSAISDYLKNNPLNSNSLTDNERRAMALMSLGINPYNGTSINYIEKITKSFDGTQFGDASLYNDDIFAIIVLANAGYSSSDEMIRKGIEFIASRQSPNGSWGSPDMTGAGIQALKNFPNISNARSAITNAISYLSTSADSLGGFGNSFSTAWALHGMSVGQASGDKILNADKYLASLQQTDGGIDPVSNTNENRIWATSYAIPASLHMSWDSIMQSFPKPSSSVDTGGGNNDNQTKNSPLPKEPVKKEDEPKKDIELKKEPIVKKIAKNKQITKKEENKTEGNALSASVASSLQDNNLKPSIIHKFVNLIKAPFVWLFMKLRF